MKKFSVNRRKDRRVFKRTANAVNSKNIFVPMNRGGRRM